MPGLDELRHREFGARPDADLGKLFSRRDEKRFRVTFEVGKVLWVVEGAFSLWRLHDMKFGLMVSRLEVLSRRLRHLATSYA